MKPVVEAVDRFQGTGHPYTVAMIGAEADSSLRHSLRPVFDSTGQASLQIVENSTAPVAFPPERWIPLQHQTDNGAMQITPGGIAVRTPRGPYAYAIGYPPLADLSQFGGQAQTNSLLFSRGIEKVCPTNGAVGRSRSRREL
jgi:hypothetical protein